MLALSVSISTSSSPLETSSPSDLSHLRIVPSSIESDRRGMATSDMAAVLPGGSVKRNTVPPPSRSSTQIRPPWRSTILRQIGEPDARCPRRPRGRAGAGTSRRRARAPRARCRCRRRRPRSAPSRAPSPSARTHTRARPSSRNFSALATRFCSSCSSCARLPMTTGRSPISISAPASTIAAASERSTSAVTERELHRARPAPRRGPRASRPSSASISVAHARRRRRRRTR